MAKGKSGGNPRSIPEGYKQVNFNIGKDLAEKVRIISFRESTTEVIKTKSDIYNEAVEEYVSRYEKKNGKLKS